MIARRLAWVLWTLFVAGVAATLLLVVLGDADGDEGLTALLIGYATVGAMIASRQRANPVGWLLLAVALTFVVQGFGEAYVSVPDLPAREYVGWVAGWSWYVWVTLVGVFLPLVFPTGRVLSPRWQWVPWLGAAGLALSIVGAAFKPGDLDLSGPVVNPLGVHGTLEDVVAVMARLGDVFIAVAFVLAGTSVVLRFRRATGRERAQLKWFSLVGGLVVLALGLAMLEVLFPGGWRRYVGAVGWFGFLFLALIGVPVATGVAILRHRLYDIDVVIRRTLVYAALTATLAAAYLGSVLLTGLAIGESDLAIAAATLAVAALFRPARTRIQAAVDHRFYRSRYDAARTLDAFGGRLRDQVDLDALAADLRGVTHETMQPAHVSLWLRSTR
jgi:hypothetical protein